MRKLLMFLCAVTLVFGMTMGSASALSWQAYVTNFEYGIDKVWSTSNQNHSTGLQAFDGNLGNYQGNFTEAGSTTLFLENLPTHTQLALEFDLYLFNSWDGNSTNNILGPDYFSLSGDVNGAWTFTNHNVAGQSYPGSPDTTFGPTGMFQTHVYLGLDPTGLGDEFLIDHSGSDFTVTFGGPTTQNDEQWGIDNVRVTLNYNGPEPEYEMITNPEPTTVLLMGIGILGFIGAATRKKLRKKAVPM